MTHESVSQVAKMQVAPNFVLPIADYDFGWQLFFAGKPEAACRNAAQVDGYYAAWAHGRAMLEAEWREAEAKDMRFVPSIEDDYEDIRRGW